MSADNRQVSSLDEAVMKIGQIIFSYESADAIKITETKSSDWKIWYTNDYPMQHGKGEQCIIPGNLVKYFATQWQSQQTKPTGLRWVKANEKHIGVMPVRITSHISGTKTYGVGLFSDNGFEMATFLNKTTINKEEPAITIDVLESGETEETKPVEEWEMQILRQVVFDNTLTELPAKRIMNAIEIYLKSVYQIETPKPVEDKP